MAGWIEQASFLSDLDREARGHLEGLRPQHVPDRATLFRPGDRAECFVILLSGRIGVYLTGRGGRELLLYAVTPGETCVQTTLGVLGGATYTGEAIAEWRAATSRGETEPEPSNVAGVAEARVRPG